MRLSTVFFLCLLTFGCQKEKQVWENAFENDQAAIAQVAQYDSIAALSEGSPYTKWLTLGKKETLEILPANNTASSYLRRLIFFVHGFGVPEMSLQTDPLGTTLPVQWPGFLVNHQDGQFFVSFREPHASCNLPPLDAKILSCENTALPLLMKEKVFRYEGNIHHGQDWNTYAPDLFWNYPQLERNPLPYCHFQIGTRHQYYRLCWQTISHSKRIALKQKVLAAKKTTRLFPIAGGGVWIELPSFLEQDTQSQALMHSIQTYFQRRPKVKFYVLDLRGNRADQHIPWFLIDAIFHDQWQMNLRYHIANPIHTWRVSTRNLSILKQQLIPMARQRDGMKSPKVKKYEQILSQLEAAQRRHQPTWKYAPTESIDAPTLSQALNIQAPIYVITDPSCQDACIHFVSFLKAYIHLIHLGQATGKLPRYGQEALYRLPSGHTRLRYPMVEFDYAASHIPSQHIPKYSIKDIHDNGRLEAFILQHVKSSHPQ